VVAAVVWCGGGVAVVRRRWCGGSAAAVRVCVCADLCSGGGARGALDGGQRRISETEQLDAGGRAVVDSRREHGDVTSQEDSATHTAEGAAIGCTRRRESEERADVDGARVGVGGGCRDGLEVDAYARGLVEGRGGG
jgi:hypothetical protein